jgi:AraC family transcriptional regulator
VRSYDRHARAFAHVPRRLGHVRAVAATAIGRRIVAELHAADDCWPLAAEGLVLELLALAGRAGAAGAERRPAWLQDVREQLHERAPAAASLSALARDAGVHPAHLARSFRRAFGVTVGDYARTLRLEWATTRLADEDTSLAEVAAGAGFADQSHFTRAFRRHTGVTPGRYRARLRI